MDTAFVRALLSHRADPNLPDEEGTAPLTAALTHHTGRGDQREMVMLLLEAKADPGPPLSKLVSKSRLRSVQLAIECRVDLEVRNGEDEDKTLLMSAASVSLSATRLLLDARADVNAEGMFGTTPLTIAAAKGNVEICRELLARGARADSGWSVGWAAHGGSPAVLELLLKARGDVNSRHPDEGLTPLGYLMHASHATRVPMLLRLLANSVDLSVVDYRGNEFWSRLVDRVADPVVPVLRRYWLDRTLPSVVAGLVEGFLE